MQNLEHIIQVISRGDTRPLEKLFSKPGGRKHLESLVSIVISNLPKSDEEQLDIFDAFINALDRIEERIAHQKQGQKILNEIFG